MDNEATRIINEKTTPDDQTVHSTKKMTESPRCKSSNKNGFSAASMAGGFVAGTAAGAVTTAFATPPDENSDRASSVQSELTHAPGPEQAILANDEGIRYAHVDADNFSDAFAQARAQVGPGGVFEYNGRLYGTYYAEEWDRMSAQEKADYQNRVNEITPVHHTSDHPSDTSNNGSNADHPSETIPSNSDLISEEPSESDIHVLGVDTVQNADGKIMNVALVECEGDQALFVDVDNNGTIDVLMHDDNHDGQYQESEVYDISGAGIEIADLLQAEAAQEGNILYASNDNLPDYVNDADSIMSV